jgi:hypothetical protein
LSTLNAPPRPQQQSDLHSQGEWIMREATRRAFLNTIGRLGGLTLVGAASPAILAAEALPATLPDVVRPAGIGSTRTLEILPLVEWATARPDLVGEAGVSYLVRTDGSTILFDVGGNLRSTDPSPLEANMQRLGLRLEEIDTIVISHLHMDHVGGLQFSSRGTFSLGLRQIDLGTRRVVVPVPMNYPGLEPVVARRPTILAPGVVTLGPITGRIAMGPVDQTRSMHQCDALADADAHGAQRVAAAAWCNWFTAVVASRAPLAPSGWPSAMAPPQRLTRGSSSARPRSRSTARPCAAKASLSSMTSICARLRPVSASTLRVAGAGPKPMMRGARPAVAMPTTRARGVRPWRAAAASLASSSAQAPSLTPLALPAVTVPSGAPRP